MITYKYTSFLSSRFSVWMHFTTFGKSDPTSLPTVIAAITAIANKHAVAPPGACKSNHWSPKGKRTFLHSFLLVLAIWV